MKQNSIEWTGKWAMLSALAGLIAGAGVVGYSRNQQAIVGHEINVASTEIKIVIETKSNKISCILNGKALRSTDTITQNQEPGDGYESTKVIRQFDIATVALTQNFTTLKDEYGKTYFRMENKDGNTVTIFRYREDLERAIQNCLAKTE